MFGEPRLLRRPDSMGSGGTSAAEATVAANPVAAPPVSQQSQTPNAQVYAPDGKTWESKFHGLSGSYQQQKAQAEAVQGALEERIRTLEDEKRQLAATLEQLTHKLELATTQLEMIPALTEKIKQLEKKSSLADKYVSLTKHPELLQLRVEQQMPGEDGQEPRVVQSNPLVELIQSTELAGADLDRVLAQISQALPSVGPQAPASPPVLPGSPEPRQGDDVEALRARQIALHEKMVAGDSSVQNEFLEIGDKIRELLRS